LPDVPVVLVESDVPVLVLELAEDVPEVSADDVPVSLEELSEVSLEEELEESSLALARSVPVTPVPATAYLESTSR
jgi:hypothetical protein